MMREHRLPAALPFYEYRFNCKLSNNILHRLIDHLAQRIIE